MAEIVLRRRRRSVRRHRVVVGLVLLALCAGLAVLASGVVTTPTDRTENDLQPPLAITAVRQTPLHLLTTIPR